MQAEFDPLADKCEVEASACKDYESLAKIAAARVRYQKAVNNYCKGKCYFSKTVAPKRLCTTKIMLSLNGLVIFQLIPMNLYRKKLKLLKNLLFQVIHN